MGKKDFPGARAAPAARPEDETWWSRADPPRGNGRIPAVFQQTTELWKSSGRCGSPQASNVLMGGIREKLIRPKTFGWRLHLWENPEWNAPLGNHKDSFSAVFWVRT
jgi:hypothetical protein